jgi:hypothetical protein
MLSTFQIILGTVILFLVGIIYYVFYYLPPPTLPVASSTPPPIITPSTNSSTPPTPPTVSVASSTSTPVKPMDPNTKANLIVNALISNKKNKQVDIVETLIDITTNSPAVEKEIHRLLNSNDVVKLTEVVKKEVNKPTFQSIQENLLKSKNNLDVKKVRRALTLING